MNQLNYLPQIIILVLMANSVFNYIKNIDKIEYNRPVNIKDCFVMLVQTVCLYYGGFIKFTLPFIIFCFLIVLGLGLIYRDMGKVKEKHVSGIVIMLIITLGLYYWGGFFDVFFQ